MDTCCRSSLAISLILTVGLATACGYGGKGGFPGYRALIERAENDSFFSFQYLVIHALFFIER